MPDLEQEIIDELGTQMQSEIDFHILADMLVEACGWHKIELFSHHKKEDILLWCEKNVKDHYQHRGTSFVFENQGDAVNFTLKWAN